MKRYGFQVTILFLTALAASIGAWTPSKATAQAVQTTIETKRYGGLLYDTTPDVISIRAAGSTEPVRYTYTKNTVYVDEAGQPVTIQTLKSGQPVMVYYTQEGDRMIASKVVVSKSPVYVGTVNEFTPDTLVVGSSNGTPVRYTYTKTTTYTDESGNPVSIETVKSGLPVTVYYNQEGDRLVASRVVVRTTRY
jgi:hypothetical protein